MWDSLRAYYLAVQRTSASTPAPEPRTDNTRGDVRGATSPTGIHNAFQATAHTQDSIRTGKRCLVGA
jgi:hypothetical protein